VNHRGIAPGAAIVGEHLLVEIRNPRRAPTHKAGLVEEAGSLPINLSGKGSG
jgi:hypothetical protein